MNMFVMVAGDRHPVRMSKNCLWAQEYLFEFWHLGIKQVKAHLFQGHIAEQFPFISACPHYQGFSQRNFCPLYFTKVLLLTPEEGVWIQISHF